MGEHGKRANEDQTDLPPDLLAKRPRLEVTSSEVDRRNERRQKNKEAAEKSRRKKKEEFAKIQTENDQLQQDKCQLVGLIESLKSDLSKLTKENKALSYNIDHLKRWIGKHARDLGLGKHVQKKEKGEEKAKTAMNMESRSRDSVLRGDPSLHSAGVTVTEDREPQDQQSADPASPSLPSASSLLLSSSGPATLAPFPVSKHLAPSVAYTQADSNYPSNHELFMPVGIRTAVSLPQPAVPPVENDNQHSQTVELKEMVHSDGQQMVHSDGQQLVDFTKDIVFIVPGEGGQQIMMVTPKVQQEVRLDAPEVQTTNVIASAVQQVSVETPQIGMEAPDVQMETQEVQGASNDVSEIKEASTEGLHASPTSVKATELQSVQSASGHNGHVKEAVLGGLTENCLAAKDTTETEKQTANASLVSAIDALLKMGFKIQLPGGGQLLPQ